MRPEHIERVLIFMHPGQWFTWSDYKNKEEQLLGQIEDNKDQLLRQENRIDE